MRAVQAKLDDAQTDHPELAASGQLGAGPNESLRLLTCGSVDDGKSTLIGRLLWDASDLHEDQRASLLRDAGASGQPDFSRLVDGLAAEREQGITIDIAWRYFDTPARRFVIIDSPGHEQYTRNMASGASHADVAILLIDARSGIKRQTRRHAAILDLMGVKRVVLAVNKMDLVDYDEGHFRQIERDFRTLAWRFGFRDAIAIPVSALAGDNVADRSANMTWFDGPSLVTHLQGLPTRGSADEAPLRFPVQYVVRDGRDFRGLAGTVAAGRVQGGDEVRDSLSGAIAHVSRIVTFDGDLAAAVTGQAVVVELDRDVDISRGAVLTGVEETVSPTSAFSARIVWLSEEAYLPGAGYLLRTATDTVPIEALDITARVNLETLNEEPSDYACSLNDIAVANVVLGRPVAVDRFASSQGTGAIMIIDALTGATVAGGVVTDLAALKVDADVVPLGDTFVLDRVRLQTGLCRDLDEDAAGREEFKRRANEVALLMRAAGVNVAVEV